MRSEHELAQLERVAQAIELSGEGLLELPALDPQDPLAAAAPAHYSARLQALMGRPRGDLSPVLQTWLDLVHPDDRQWLEDERRRQLAEPGALRTLEYRVLVDGELHWWRERSQSTPGGEPGRVRLLALVCDISDERREGVRVQRELDLLRQTQASARVGGWEVDLAKQELYWTEETHRIHEVPPGFKPDLATAINFYAPEHVPIITDAVERCMGGEPFDVELDIITHTGRRLHVHAAGRPYHEHGELTRMYGTFRDITESRQREDELRRQVELIERQEGAIQALSTPIIQIWDKIITLPVIGIVDSERANHIMDRLLAEVTRVRARYAILDLTGVDDIDTGTADHLLQIVRAVKLLGATGLLCGLQPAVAHTLSDLGVDMSPLLAHRNLQEALQRCIRDLNLPARNTRSS